MAACKQDVVSYSKGHVYGILGPNGGGNQQL
jgi:ABC-type Na+ transport system ATPase subunit NatA